MKCPVLSLCAVALVTQAWSATSPRYLIPHLYTADPSAHAFGGKLFLYPSHDVESDIPSNSAGDHFDMRDYHVFSLDSIDGEVTDHGVALHLRDIPWAQRQLWAPDCAQRDGRYYLYFPAKDRQDVFRIGVAVGDRPEGPFKPEAQPIQGTYSIDPCVFRDGDGAYYLYFGGLWGGQLERYRSNEPLAAGREPANDEPALGPKVGRLADSMRALAEAPREVQILDADGKPVRAGDHERRFFEAAWIHKYNGRYYLSYSTGDTHFIAYAAGDNPYGPFTYQGVVLTPVVGWTTHHSITEFQGTWYLFHHDSRPSGGKAHLRSVKVVELEHDAEGRIKTIDAER